MTRIAPPATDNSVLLRARAGPGAGVLCAAILALTAVVAVADSGDTLDRAKALGQQHPEKAIAVLDEALADLSPEQDPARLARLYNLRANLARDLGRLDAALADVERVIELAERAGETVLQAEALRVRGTIAAEHGRVDAALEHFHRAWELLEGTGATDVQLRVAIALGVGHTMIENYEHARDYYERGLRLARELDDPRQEATVLGNLALVVAELESPDAGLELHRQALSLGRELGDDTVIAYQLANICDRLVSLGRTSEAGEVCHDAVARLETLGHARLLAGARGSLGALHAENGELDAALEQYSLALEAAKDRIPTVERDFLARLAELHERRGDHAAALDAYRRYMDAREALWEEGRRRTIEELEVQHELAQRERELDLTRARADLQAADLRQRNWLLIGLFSAFVLLASLVAVGWRSYRVRTRLQQEVIRRNRELEEAVETIGQLAREDPLTALHNRRAFLELARQEMARARRSGKPLSAMMGDIDHFKPINDRHGHAAGDDVLMKVADRLRATLREQDILCRWGGEEFLLLLPETGPDAANQAAERARQSIAASAVTTEAGEMEITMTFGVASVTDDLDEAINAADRAMYEGKQAGRNRVVVHHDS